MTSIEILNNFTLYFIVLDLRLKNKLGRSRVSFWASFKSKIPNVALQKGRSKHTKMVSTINLFARLFVHFRLKCGRTHGPCVPTCHVTINLSTYLLVHCQLKREWTHGPYGPTCIQIDNQPLTPYVSISAILPRNLSYIVR